jgi:hypothetical protein
MLIWPGPGTPTACTNRHVVVAEMLVLLLMSKTIDFLSHCYYSAAIPLRQPQLHALRFCAHAFTHRRNKAVGGGSGDDGGGGGGMYVCV